jgi:hypothetical protein
MQQLSASITSTAVMTGAVFPNLTLPHFEISGGYVNGFGGIVATAYAPIITDEKRKQWEDYAASNGWWLNASTELVKVHPGHLDPLHGTKDEEHEVLEHNESESAVSESIFHKVNGSKVPLTMHLSKVYAPLWQISPPISTAVNEDLLSNKIIADLYFAMIATNRTVLSAAAKAEQFFDFIPDKDNVHWKYGPHGVVAEPVYDSFSAHPKVVGMVVALAPFDNLLDFLLPNNVKGVICVITDTCGNAITYEINGPNVTFLGSDDLHDPAYKHLEQSAHLEISYEMMVDGLLCGHDIHLYPSSTLQNSYETRKPGFYAFIVVFSFFLTSILIVIYDLNVSKRQEKTMISALQNGALVASLFPATVRARLLQEETQNRNERQNLASVDEGENKNSLSGCKFRTRPIADFFPNVTLMCECLRLIFAHQRICVFLIFFLFSTFAVADITGFTAWSSTRGE